MIKQSYLQYLQSRLNFNLQVALWMEFDIDKDSRFQFIKDNNGNPVPEKGDMTFCVLPFCKETKMPPMRIVETLMPYLKTEGVARFERLNGYINVFFDRAIFLLNIQYE